MEEHKVLDFIGFGSMNGGDELSVVGVVSLNPPTSMEFTIHEPEYVDHVLENAYEESVDLWVESVREGETLLGYDDWFAENMGTREQKINNLFDMRNREEHETIKKLANLPDGTVVSASGPWPLISVDKWFPGKRSAWEDAILAGWRAVGEENKFVTGEW